MWYFHYYAVNLGVLDPHVLRPVAGQQLDASLRGANQGNLLFDEALAYRKSGVHFSGSCSGGDHAGQGAAAKPGLHSGT